MKARKAIKRIAALGVGATMMGATLMGAMAADLSEYPGMFIEDGQFNGLLVVGKNANAIDTIGVTNIALGLQKAAVTKTQVCGDATASTTTVSGEMVQLEKPGEDLNLGDDLYSVQSVSLDDADLPNLLAEGEFKDNEGENKDDIDYDQNIDFTDNVGVVNYYFDKDDADPSGVFLKFDNGDVVYTYTMEFKSDLKFDDEEDLKSTTMTIQGRTYTLTDVDINADGDDIDKITMMVGESVMWIAEGEVITKDIDGVEHTIKMIDVANDATSCGFDVDGSSIWIDVDETETISGVTLGVTEAREVNVKDSDNDICKVFIGANELELEEGNDGVSVAGSEVDGSVVAFGVTGDTDDGDAVWEDLTISYEADDDTYIGEDDVWVDPVFGNFKFIVGNVISENEEIEFTASSDDGMLKFISYDDKEVEIPFIMEGEGVAYFLGTDADLGANSDEGYYTEGQICDPTSGEVNDCVGAHFIGVVDDVVHIVKITDIDEDDSEISFDDITYDTTTDDVDYINGEMSIRGGLGEIKLTITGSQITFTEIDDSGAAGDSVFKTLNEGEIQIFVTGDELDATPAFQFTENDDSDADVTIDIDLTNDDDDLQFDSPTGAGLSSSYKASDDDDDTEIYTTVWGNMVTTDSDTQDYVTIMHPEEQLYLEVFLAETEAMATTNEGAGEGCTVSTTLNPIPSTVNKFDTEVSNPGAQNLIAVGGPCANSVSSALLGNPEVCYEGFEEGKAMLKLVESGSNVALVVAGGVGKDTQLASIILQNYEDYELSGMDMVATTVSESGLKVEAAMSDAE